MVRKGSVMVRTGCAMVRKQSLMVSDRTILAMPNVSSPSMYIHTIS